LKRKGEQKWNKRSIAFQLLIIFTASFLLNACSIKEGLEEDRSNKKLISQQNHNSKSQKWRTSITDYEGEFFKVIGWLSNNQLLFITNKGQTSNLYRYELITGHSELLYKSDQPIVTALASPSKKYILIQSTPSSYEGIITIIDRKGKTKYKQELASFELEYAWNPYNETEILVSKFNEDWTFEVFKLDIKKKGLVNLSLTQPFVKWVDRHHIAYMNWDQNNPALFAPIVMKDLSSTKEKIAFKKVYQFTTFQDLLLTITVNEQENTQAIYSFFDRKNQSVFSFTIPQLTKFSDWLVPFYDFNEGKQQFLTFQPLKSGESDTYVDGFQLVSYQLKTGKSSILFDGMDNEPISCSPSGEACLYGGRFEKLIDLKSKKIYNLVKE
jgi:hypothetical protein